jgi:hypothetical protein
VGGGASRETQVQGVEGARAHGQVGITAQRHDSDNHTVTDRTANLRADKSDHDDALHLAAELLGLLVYLQTTGSELHAGLCHQWRCDSMTHT